MSKFSRAPKQLTNSLDAFIEGAGKPAATPAPQVKGKSVNASLPWDDPMVRADVLKAYNLRLPEPYLLKLKYIASHTPASMQAFCLSELLPAIDQKVDEILSAQSD